jgi:glycerol-3-phosphate dehydrogenase
VIGGKLTTFRSLAEEAVDDVFKKLAKKAPKCTTGQVPLPGAETEDYAAFCQKFSESSKLSPETSRRLLHVYGTRSTEILDLIDQDPDLTEPFSPDMGAIAAEIVLALQQEMAETLADVLLRRTMVGFGTSVGLDADENAAKVAQKYLGWDRQRAEEEVAAYRRYIERFHPRQLPNV